MTEPRPLLLIGAVSIIAAIISASSGSNFGLALLTGGAAALGAGAILILLLVDRVRPAPPPVTTVDTEVLVTLRDAMTSGAIGRGRIIAAVQTADWTAGGSSRPLTVDEERRLLELSQVEFRAWLSGELDRLEHET